MFKPARVIAGAFYSAGSAGELSIAGPPGDRPAAASLRGYGRPLGGINGALARRPRHLALGEKVDV